MPDAPAEIPAPDPETGTPGGKKKGRRRVKTSVKDALQEPSAQRLQTALEKTFQTVWKNEGALAKHLDGQTKAAEKLAKQIEGQAKGLEKIAARLDALESRPAAEAPAPAPAGFAGDAGIDGRVQGLQQELLALRDELSSVRETAARMPDPAALTDAVEAALAALGKRLADLEAAPSPDPGGGRDTLGEGLLLGIRALEDRVDALERLPAPPPAFSPEDARSAVAEELARLAARVAALEGAPAPAPAGPTEARVTALVAEGKNAALAGAREMIEKAGAETSASWGRTLDARLADTLSKADVADLMRKVAESAAAPEPADTAALETTILAGVKTQILPEIRKTVTAVFSSSQFRELLKKQIDPGAVVKALSEHIERDVLSTLLNSNEMKELLDDKFKIMRNWLKNEELPKQIQKHMDA